MMPGSYQESLLGTEAALIIHPSRCSRRISLRLQYVGLEDISQAGAPHGYLLTL